MNQNVSRKQFQNGKRDTTILIDNTPFYRFETDHLDTEGFLFELGDVFVCKNLLERFDAHTIRKRLMAHGRREVGEYNRWLMPEEELSNLEYGLNMVIKINREHTKHDIIGWLDRTLPPELSGIVEDLTAGHTPDPERLLEKVQEYFTKEEAREVLARIEEYLSYSSADDDTQTDDFWASHILEEKEFDSIENEEEVDSFFIDRMVIMTTPGRRATIVYLEDGIHNIYDFYKLDSILAA